MRTKTLLLSAVLGAVGIAAASAQVYSVNVVGYTTISAPSGFSMIANQLSSTNNTIAGLLPTPPDGTIVYKFSGGSFVANNYFGGWLTPTMTLNPGEGAFLFNPTASALPITFVGEVIQGATTNALPAGFSIRSLVTPQAGTLDSFGYPVADGDIVYRFSGGFVAYNYFGGWAPSVPSVNVGESFFAFKGAATSWTRTFTVQ